MSVIGFASAKGSPGVTTTVLSLAGVWPETYPGRRVVVVDADVAGSDLVSGLLQGSVDASAGVLPLATKRPTDPLDSVWQHVLSLDEAGHRLLLPGVADPSKASAAAPAWATLQAAIPGMARLHPPTDVLVDLGRIGIVHEPVALRSAMDLLVLVTGSSLAAVSAARFGARRLSGEGARLALLVVGERRPYPAGDIAAALDVELLGTLPHDSRSAEASPPERLVGHAARCHGPRESSHGISPST